MGRRNDADAKSPRRMGWWSNAPWGLQKNRSRLCQKVCCFFFPSLATYYLDDENFCLSPFLHHPWPCILQDDYGVGLVWGQYSRSQSFFRWLRGKIERASDVECQAAREWVTHRLFEHPLGWWRKCCNYTGSKCHKIPHCTQMIILR